MTHPVLGKLVTLPAQQVWGHEAAVFTPWLAANLDLLAEPLGIDELELQGTEVPAGDFRLDILAEDSAGNAVLIENQFGATDHRHLGQLISYVASQNRRATVIWVAERFKDDHRAAIDWLNAATGEDYSFFAVEIEALKIGDSQPAPFFNVVAKPNRWTKTVRSAGPAASDGSQGERHKVRLAYWSAFAEYLRQNDPSFVIRRDNRDHWFEFRIGRGGVVISATISTQKKRVGVELYLSRDPLKSGIRQLAAERETIEAEMGQALDWQELPTKRASRIALFLDDVDPASPDQYAALHAWMLDKMQRFRRVFGARVKALTFDADDDRDEDGFAAVLG
ncbi:DUF4268 domain-containing protein [Sphingomonas sp.]|uniref:DUF4268 domain-containing protein n=1 Tax=Sphingomonas sp. TaxID=28214 RepID=UPI002EDBA2D1